MLCHVSFLWFITYSTYFYFYLFYASLRSNSFIIYEIRERRNAINFSTALNKSFSKRSAMSIVDVSLEQILSCLFPSNVFSSSRSRMDTSALRKSREPPRAFASQCERCLLGPFSFPSSVFFSTTASTSSIPILSIYRYYFLMYFRYTTFFRRLADFHRLRFVAKKKFCRKDRQVF